MTVLYTGVTVTVTYAGLTVSHLSYTDASVPCTAVTMYDTLL